MSLKEQLPSRAEGVTDDRYQGILELELLLSGLGTFQVFINWHT